MQQLQNVLKQPIVHPFPKICTYSTKLGDHQYIVQDYSYYLCLRPLVEWMVSSSIYMSLSPSTVSVRRTFSLYIIPSSPLWLTEFWSSTRLPVSMPMPREPLWGRVFDPPLVTKTLKYGVDASHWWRLLRRSWLEITFALLTTPTSTMTTPFFFISHSVYSVTLSTSAFSCGTWARKEAKHGAHTCHVGYFQTYVARVSLLSGISWPRPKLALPVTLLDFLWELRERDWPLWWESPPPWEWERPWLPYTLRSSRKRSQSYRRHNIYVSYIHVHVECNNFPNRSVWCTYRWIDGQLCACVVHAYMHQTTYSSNHQLINRFVHQSVHALIHPSIHRFWQNCLDCLVILSLCGNCICKIDIGDSYLAFIAVCSNPSIHSFRVKQLFNKVVAHSSIHEHPGSS